MLKELTYEELKEQEKDNPKSACFVFDLGKYLESGVKLKIKEKTTIKKHSYVVYIYDPDFYRYIQFCEYII